MPCRLAMLGGALQPLPGCPLLRYASYRRLNQPARRDRSVLRTRRPRASPLSRPRWLSRSQWACGQREPPSVRVIACWSRSRSGRPVRRSGSPVLRRRTRNHHRRQRLPPRQGTGTRPRHQPGRRTAHRRVRRPSRVLGAQPALTSGIRAMAPAGRVALVGMGADSVSIDVPIIQGRELTISGVFRYANTYPLAPLIASGAVNVTEVISHRFPLAETEQALTDRQAGSPRPESRRAAPDLKSIGRGLPGGKRTRRAGDSSGVAAGAATPEVCVSGCATSRHPPSGRRRCDAGKPARQEGAAR